jgi:hypothetical protein
VTLVAESDALHARVRAFQSSSGASEPFQQLALDVARFQARHSPGFARLCAAAPHAFDGALSIPAVPSGAFRVARVAVHPPELDRVRFVTSGTSGPEPGMHAMRTTETYRALCLAGARRALPPGPHVVVALAPDPGDPGESSLGFMIRAFMEELDGRDLDAPRWLMSAAGVDLAGLRHVAELAFARAEPVLLVGTSFALAALLDALGSDRIPLPPDSIVVYTGGFKGRRRELEPDELAESVSAALGLGSGRFLGEYGMTELSSQLYEQNGVYVPPPWLSVTAVDPVSLEPLGAGESGLARFVDLGNVDSAVAVLTEDRVRQRGAGVELLGRNPGALPRGCSLAIEALAAR